VTTDDSGQFLAVAGMNGKAVSIYTKNVTGSFEYTQTIKHQFEMPISVTFAQNGLYLIAVDAMNSDIVIFQQRNNQSYELKQVMNKTEHSINGLNKVAFLKDNESIMTFSEQSHRIDKFELIDSALKHTQTLSVPSLQSATSLELLDSHHAVSTWAKSDSIAVFKIVDTKKATKLPFFVCRKLRLKVITNI
jgi:6-phosphogluconolactonase (cycloisomerase 2 family)